MALKSQTFLVRKGDNLETLSSFFDTAIGLDSYLIKDISAVKISEEVTQLTFLYQDSPDFIVDSYAPRPGAILTSGVLSSDFDYRILFNNPIDPNSIQLGSFSIDGIDLPVSRVSVDANSNNYFIKLHLSGSSDQTVDFHEIRIDPTKIRRQNNIPMEYAPVAGYVINSSSTFHLGDNREPYSSRRRGRAKLEVIRSRSGNVQQAVSEYFLQRNIAKERLIRYTSCVSSSGYIEIYILYLSSLEPQIIEGFPLSNTFVPDTSINDSLTLVYNTKLDPEQLSSESLFSIHSGYSSPTNIDPSDIFISSDFRTVTISLASYLGPERVFSVVSNPGLRSYDGFTKVKPEQWVFHIQELPISSGFSGTITTAQISDFSEGVLDTVGNATSAGLGTTVVYNDTANTITVGMEGVFYTGLTGHTGQANIHFTEASINHNNIQNVGAYPHTSIDSHIEDVVSNPHSVTAAQVGAPTLAAFTGHTGQTNIHYTQAQISIPASQISDFNESVDDRVSTLIIDTASVDFSYNDSLNQLSGTVLPAGVDHNSLANYVSNEHIDHSTVSAIGINGLTGFGDITANFTISGLDATTSTKGVSSYSSSFFTVSAGAVSIANNSIDNLQLAQMPARTILANTGSSTATSVDATDSDIITHILTGVTLVNGSRGFTAVILGVYPTAANHLSTKSYVDDQISALSLLALTLFQPIDATLTTIAAQTTAADRYIYFTGVDQAFTGAITSFARTLLDDITAAAARSTLGLGEFSTLTLDSSQGDILYYNGTSWTNLAIGTEGQVLRVSAGGIPEWNDL